jgi:hypothetical protein
VPYPNTLPIFIGFLSAAICGHSPSLLVGGAYANPHLLLIATSINQYVVMANCDDIISIVVMQSIKLNIYGLFTYRDYSLDFPIFH